MPWTTYSKFKYDQSLKSYQNSATNWLGKVTNDSLQRVYGIAFPSDKLLKEYIKKKEEEEKKGSQKYW